MDFSRPDNARTINRLKVLNVLRTAPATKSDIAKATGLNKASIGDIIDSLITEGTVELAGTKASASGRPSQLAGIKAEAGRVFSIEMRNSSLEVAVSDLLGRTLRYERFPMTEGWEGQLEKTLARMRGSEGVRIYGGVVSSALASGLSSLSGFPVLTLPPSVIEARSEQARLGRLDGFMFVSWSESFDACFRASRGLEHLSTFGHLRVAKEGKCGCGATGCLNAVASVRYLKERTGEQSTRALFKDSPALRQSLKALAFALSSSVQVLGAKSVIITGGMSGMEDSCYAFLQSLLSQVLPPDRQDVVVYRSVSGDKGSREGAAAAALDAFFYRTELLGQLAAIESFSGL